MHQKRASEARLDELREEAARTGHVQTSGVVPIDSVLPKRSAPDYHGLPVLKPPTWTWQVPLYFFAGGIAGAAAAIAFIAHLLQSDPGLIRAALWVGLAGALVSPPLLIADLGRPSRFLNMMRVFKWRSPMSLGAWTLAVFSSFAFLAVACFELSRAGFGNEIVSAVGWVAQAAAAATGLVLLSYTSVLLGVSAIPVWSENRTLLPPHFVASALGAAAAVLELLGLFSAATQRMAIAAAALETVIGIVIEVRRRPVDKPLREGSVGWAFRTGGVLAGPVSLLLRVFFGHSVAVRQLASVCFIVGALIIRFAWIAAGRASARDPQALFGIQRPHQAGASNSVAERQVVATESAG